MLKYYRCLCEVFKKYCYSIAKKNHYIPKYENSQTDNFTTY